MNAAATSSIFPTDWTTDECSVWQSIADSVQQWRADGQTIVVATGVFDLFHSEHQAFLQRAREVGDILVVGVESDRRVKELKGSDRPYQSQEQRLAQVQSLPFVDVAAILPEAFRQAEHYTTWAQLLNPAILAVSSHSPFLENKRAIMQQFGGDVQVVHEHNPLVSTTRIAQQRTIESAE